MENGNTGALRLGALSTEDVLVCRDCGVLLLKDLLKPRRRLVLLGPLGLDCPVCERRLLDLEQHNEEWD